MQSAGSSSASQRVGSPGSAGAGGPSAERVGSPSDKHILPHEFASNLVAKYNKGLTRVPLEQLGVSRHNRPISFRYVHSKLKKILYEEGFSKMRYQFAIAIEPEDGDKFAANVRTNEEAADSNGMLPTVGVDSPRFGLLTKNHLFLGLLVLKAGNIRCDHNPDDIWTAPAVGPDGRHQELHDTLNQGMWVQLLKKEIWKEQSTEDIKLIMEVDNQDQVTGLPDHEMHLFMKICNAMDARVVSPGEQPVQPLWNRVQAKLSQGLGQRFNEKQCINVYNCALKLGKQHQDFIVKFHFHFVNPSALVIRPSHFGLAATLPDECPWGKVALLAHCYMCDKKHYIQDGGGSLVIADGIKEKQMSTLVSQTDFVVAVEAYLTHCLAGCQPTAKDKPAVVRAMANFMYQAGYLMYKGDPEFPGSCEEHGQLGKFTDFFCKTENQLWDEVGKCGVERRAYMKAKDSGLAAQKGKKADSQEVLPDAGPRLEFDSDGSLQMTAAYLSAQDGVVEGVVVEVSRDLAEKNKPKRRRLSKGEFGPVVAFVDDNVVVDFGKAGQKDEQCLPRKSVALKKSVASSVAESQASEDQRRVDSPPNTLDQESFIKWEQLTGADGSWRMKEQVRECLWCLVQSLATKDDQLGFESVTALPTALKDFETSEIKLVPYSRFVSIVAPKTSAYVTATVSCKGSRPQKWYISEPEETASGVDSPEKTEAVQTLSPFWNAIKAKGTKGPNTPIALRLEKATYFVSSTVVPKDKKADHKGSSDKVKLEITIPLLTNAKPVPMGKRVRFTPGSQDGIVVPGLQ